MNYTEILIDCLQEANGDIESAFLAAEYIVDNNLALSIDYGDNSKAANPGMMIDIGQPKSAPGPAFPVDPDEYPRNKSKQYIPKKVLAKASKDDKEYLKLRESTPTEYHGRLQRAIGHLQSGGTVNHPNEHPKLGVDSTGEIAHPEWRYHQFKLDNRKDWIKRTRERIDKRDNILEATKLVRNSSYITKLHKSVSSLKGDRADISSALDRYNIYLDDVVDSLESISTDDSQLRELDRLRHNADMEISRNIGKEDFIKVIEEHTTKLHNLFEDILEESHKRLDEEEESDKEPEIPQEPVESEDSQFTTPSHFSLDEINAALASEVTWTRYQGPRGGRGWKSSTGRIVYGERPTTRGGAYDDEHRTKGTRIPTISGRISTDREETTVHKGQVDETPTRPSNERVDKDRTGESKLTRTQTPRPIPTGKPEPLPTIKRPASEQRAVLEATNRELERYSHYFNSKKQPDVSEWFDDLKEHINTVGADRALSQLSVPTHEPVTTTKEGENVQYKGTGYFKGDKGLKFLEEYLDEVGITLVTGNRYNPNKRLIASAPVESAVKAAKKGDVVSIETVATQTKLDESKLLPGLESSEDIHTLVGHEVSQFTPDVLSTLDATYGKGKWIVKSYGNEAYAGFGIFFPQRLKEIQRGAKQTIFEMNKSLKKFGYSISRDVNGQVNGLKDNQGKIYKFGSDDFSNIPNEKVKKLGMVAAASAPQEHGARLPTTPEVAIRQDYGITLTKGSNGKVTGLIDSDGNNIPYNSPKWRKLVKDEYSTIGHEIERAVDAINLKKLPDPHFMVQPAFKVVGVTELDRALGFTWETSNEGRVHVTTNGGRASVVPYATLAGRADAFPVVFTNDDIRAMEKAVQDTIDALPESERSGQTYAPDVIKTSEGWRVVELNAASEFGESLWLEENPFVIDAYVSHLTGKKPSHVQFIQSLLQGEASKLKGLDKIEEGTDVTPKGKTPNSKIAELRARLQGKISKDSESTVLSTDDEGHEHAPAGSGKGGQFVKKGGGGSSSLSKTRSNPDNTQQPSRKIPVVGGQGNVITATKSSVSGAIRGALIGFKSGLSGNPEKVSRQEHDAVIEKALTKFEKAPQPTPQELAQNLAGLELKGAQRFRRDLVGNNIDRRRRREKLLLEFGDGVKCPCLYCGVLLKGDGDLEQDKMYTTAQGGRYRPSNLVPSCKRCNGLRGDMPFEEAMEKVVNYDRDPRTA